MSWRHYTYGTQYLARADAREQMRTAGAVRAAGAVDRDFRGWRREMSRWGGV